MGEKCPPSKYTGEKMNEREQDREAYKWVIGYGTADGSNNEPLNCEFKFAD